MSVLATIDIEGTFNASDSVNALSHFLRQSDARVSFNGVIRLTAEDEEGRDCRELISNQIEDIERIKTALENKDAEHLPENRTVTEATI